MLFTSDLYSRKPVSYINFVIVLDSGARGDWEGRAPARQKGVAGIRRSVPPGSFP